METGHKRSPEITTDQIIDAANMLCQLDQKYGDLPSNYYDPVQYATKMLRAEQVLQQAGMDRVRKLSGGHYMDHLDPKFWARADEIETCKRILLNNLQIGYIPLGKFMEYGLDGDFSYTPNLVRESAGEIPLSIQARERLFSGAAKTVQEELRALNPDHLQALAILDPEGLMSRLLRQRSSA